jgi:DNA polymerase-3 subunit gamma/tau
MIMLRMLAFRPEKISATTDKSISNNKQTQISAASPLLSTDTQYADILQNLNVTEPTKALLAHCLIVKIGQNEVELLLEANKSPLLNKKHEERINQAFSEHLKRKITVNIKLGASNINTAANIAQREAAQKQDQALQSIEKDHRIKELIDKFGAKIISDPIKI